MGGRIERTGGRANDRMRLVPLFAAEAAAAFRNARTPVTFKAYTHTRAPPHVRARPYPTGRERMVVPRLTYTHAMCPTARSRPPHQAYTHASAAALYARGFTSLRAPTETCATSYVVDLLCAKLLLLLPLLLLLLLTLLLLLSLQLLFVTATTAAAAIVADAAANASSAVGCFLLDVFARA